VRAIGRLLVLVLCLVACAARLTVTRADGEAMRLALIEHLSSSDNAELRAEAERLRHAAPHIVDGQLRIGPWWFEQRERGAVLVWDQHSTPAAVVYQVAYLEGRSGGAWDVMSVSEEIHHLEP
jgi:hypothetical protein